MNQGVRIPGRGRKCARCSAPFLVGHLICSVLRLDDFTREDLCQGCFDAGPPREGTIHWKARRPKPRQASLKVDLDSVEELFHRLLREEDSEGAAGLRYVAALLLVRKRRLKLVASPEEGPAQDLVVLVAREGSTEQESLRLPPPDLSPESLERLRDQLLDSLRWTD